MLRENKIWGGKYPRFYIAALLEFLVDARRFHCCLGSFVFGNGLARHWSSGFISNTVVNVIALLQGCSYWSKVPLILWKCVAGWSTQLAKLWVR